MNSMPQTLLRPPPRRHLRRRGHPPVLPILRQQNFELQLSRFIGNRIAQHDSVLRIPEDHRIKESLGIRIAELQMPALTAIARVINARQFPRPRRHQERFVGRKCHDRAKVQCARVRHLRRSPGTPAVGGSQVGPVRSAGPRYGARYRAHPAQAFRGMGEEHPRPGLAEGRGGNQQKTQQSTHEELY